MQSLGLIIGIVLLIILLVWLYKLFKPYFLKYDSTLLMTGGLGSGKTLTTVKTAVVLIRRQIFIHYTCYNFFKVKIGNWFIKKKNKIVARHNIKLSKKYKGKELPKKKKLWKIKKLNEPRRKPQLYSNIPIHYKKHIFGRKRTWNVKLTAEHLVLLEEIIEYSVVVIDELPQFINQFNWSEKLIQENVNEFITFFRHYIGGFLIVNAQAVDDVVVQIRRKLNQATFCFNFKKHLFGLFYTIDMCDIMLSEQMTTITTTYLEDNTKKHFGLFPKKGTYSSRCYSPRYEKVNKKNVKPLIRDENIKTTKVLRLMKYKSPLDDLTTKEEQQKMREQGEKIWKN